MHGAVWEGRFRGLGFRVRYGVWGTREVYGVRYAVWEGRFKGLGFRVRYWAEVYRV